MDPRFKKRLEKSWAGLFYKHVFCKIDEKLFAPLYSSNNGRPNFPINIYQVKLNNLGQIEPLRLSGAEIFKNSSSFATPNI